jgi:hypothetical protein
LLAIGFKKYGSLEELNKSPIKHLLDVKKSITNIFIFYTKSLIDLIDFFYFSLTKVYVKANKDESLKNDALKYFSEMEQGIKKMFNDLN